MELVVFILALCSTFLLIEAGAGCSGTCSYLVQHVFNRTCLTRGSNLTKVMLSISGDSAHVKLLVAN